MYLESLLAELSAELGIAPLAVQTQDRCAVFLGGDVHVELHWRPATGMLRLVALVGDPAMHRERLLTTLLAGNLALAERGKPVFALEPGTDAVVLTQSLDTARLTATRLASRIRTLAGACRKVRAALATDQAILA